MSAEALDKTSFTPLYFQLKEVIRGDILSRKLVPGEKLPAEPDLADKYGISRVTARKALQELKKENLLVQFPAKGTFVAELTGNPAQQTFALIIPTRGHVYENESGAIIRRLQECGNLTVVVDSGDYQSNPDQQESILKNIIDKGVSGIVVEGLGNFPFELLEEYKEQMAKLVFINKCEYRYSGLADYVMSNIREGANVATRHLIELGHKNILLNTHDPTNVRKNAPDYYISEHFLFIEGYRETMEESGLRPLYSYLDPVAERDGVISLLSGPERPEAILTSSDFRALKIIDCCKELGIGVPEDLAIAGYYNTPWSQFLDTTITSVSIKEDVIAEEVADLLLASGKINESQRIIVKPELIVRKSTGGN